MVLQPEVKRGALPKEVLVVDDDVVIRMLVADALRNRGVCVIEAGSGADALGYLTSGGRPDLIFSDIQMPGSIDGLQLADYVHETYPDIPVILTSGSAVPPDQSKGVTVIPKPFGIYRVLDHLIKILDTPSDEPAK